MLENTPFSGPRLRATINILPDGRAKLDALAEAIRQADAADDPFWRLSFRWEYASQAAFHDDPPKAMPVAAEFAAIYDAYPDALGSYGPRGYVILALMGLNPVQSLPQIPLAEYDTLLERFRALTRRFGVGEQNYWWELFNRWFYIDQTQALDCLQSAWQAPEDEISDCMACMHARGALLYLRLGDRAKADEYAKPLITYEIEPCESSFQSLWLAYLEDALDRGDLDEAAPLAEKLACKGNRDRRDLSYVSGVLRCWSFTDPNRALALFSRRLVWTFGMWDQKSLYDFYKAAWICFQQTARRREQVTLDLPEDFPLYQKAGQYVASVLADWFHQQAAEIGTRFDQRNQADFFARDLAAAAGSLH